MPSGKAAVDTRAGPAGRAGAGSTAGTRREGWAGPAVHGTVPGSIPSVPSQSWGYSLCPEIHGLAGGGGPCSPLTQGTCSRRCLCKCVHGERRAARVVATVTAPQSQARAEASGGTAQAGRGGGRGAGSGSPCGAASCPGSTRTSPCSPPQPWPPHRSTATRPCGALLPALQVCMPSRWREGTVAAQAAV